MKSMPVLEVRKHLGEVLDHVRLKCETVIIERSGRPMARLCPLEGSPSTRDGVASRLHALERLAGMGAPTARGDAVDDWLELERASWGDKP